MKLSVIDHALLLAAYFRGNNLDQDRWTSCCAQVVILSLFYTGEIAEEDCQAHFMDRGYVTGIFNDEGELTPHIETRYRQLIELIRSCPQLIEGAGNLEMPADPVYTACRLTVTGIRLIPEIIERFPRKPDFPNWPDKQTFPSNAGFME